MVIKCPECGHQVSDRAKTCPSCGIEIAGKITRCPDCGEVIFKEEPSCPNCHCTINGASVVDTLSEEPRVPMQPMEPLAEQSQQLQRQPAPRRPRKHRAGITALIVAFVIALIVMFLGIYFMKTQEKQNELRAYMNAIQSSEPLVLQNFLDMYADAPREHCDSIKKHLEVLKKVDSDWTDALVHNTKFSFQQYISRYPQSVHNVEAKLKIDSLDWATADKENTAEAYKAYIDEHQDGAYYDEAHAKYEQLEAQKVTAEDRLLVNQVFSTYFNALAQRDESGLSSTLAPVLTSFLHRQNATIADVLQYMQKIHEDDIEKIVFTPNNDWAIEKQQQSDDRYAIVVKFTVAQHMERTDDSRETDVVYKIDAKLSPDGRISELNMKRSVSPAQ